MKILKQVLGIDVAQKELVVCFGIMNDIFEAALIGHETFANSKAGFAQLVKWAKKLSVENASTNYVMEATGVYHENLAYYLHDHDMDLSIVLPNKISNYARSLDVKTVTDKTASRAIAMFGLERKLDNWMPPKGIYRSLKQLGRERGQLLDERTVIKNQLHAKNAGAKPSQKEIKRAEIRLALLVEQEKEIKKELADLIKQDPEVKEIVLLICSISGIGLLTVSSILGETNGFEHTSNRRQLTSYAGFDVKEKQSGTSIKGKSKISKRGNKYLRKAMHMPSLSAIKHDPTFRAIYEKVFAKTGIKMKGIVAVQRRLLEMSYIIFKKQEKYIKNYSQQKEQSELITEVVK